MWRKKTWGMLRACNLIRVVYIRVLWSVRYLVAILQDNVDISSRLEEAEIKKRNKGLLTSDEVMAAIT
jgi:hypothetical protein